jgi:transaldolase
MDIFADTANLVEIKKWMRRGVLDGVTTNPTIMLRDGVRDMEQAAREIAEVLAGRPVSIEVTTNDPEEMVEQGRRFAQWAPNIVVKIPIINEDGIPCLGAIHTLAGEGIKVNTTAILSFNQVMMAAKAGATFLSIFAGRVADEGHDPSGLIATAVRWVERWGYGKILVGSIRGHLDLQMAAVSGAHIITVPPAILEKALDHKYSRETVKGFNADARKALADMKRPERQRPEVPAKA